MVEKIKDGYTRVSEIVSVPGMFDMIPPDVLENKVRIGTNVHEAIHMDFLGFVPDLAEDEKSTMKSKRQALSFGSSSLKFPSYSQSLSM